MKIQKAGEKALFLRTQFGKGKFGDEEVSISLAVNGSSLLVEFEESKYIVNVQSIVEDVIEFRKLEKKKGELKDEEKI